MTKNIRLGAAVVLPAAAALLAWLFVLHPPGTPSREDGQALLAGFADLLTSPRALGARGPDALALFPGLGTWSGDPCATEWRRKDPFAPVVTQQWLELGRLGADACDQAQFGGLSTTFRQSEGVTPGILVERFTERFGPPEVHRGTGRDDPVTYGWDVLEGIFIRLEEPVRPDSAFLGFLRGADEFSVRFLRSYGTPTALATPEEGEQWMDSTVALLTGPDLPAARGAAAAGMVGVEMLPRGSGGTDCPTIFSARQAWGQIASGQSLLLDLTEGGRCEDAAFGAFSMRAWQRKPVTAEALVKRIEAKLGAPEASRNFERRGIRYRWRTAHRTTVQLFEGLSDGLEHLLFLSVSRDD